MSSDARLTGEHFDASSEYASFAGALTDEGGVVSFTGRARPRSKNGFPVERLFLEQHPRLTQKSLDEIAQAARQRFPVSAIRIVHRYGDIHPGDAIVFVAAGAAHRRAAFEAADYMMDRLKTDAVFWKREDAVDGSRWIEPSHSDRAERARWGE